MSGFWLRRGRWSTCCSLALAAALLGGSSVGCAFAAEKPATPAAAGSNAPDDEAGQAARIERAHQAYFAKAPLLRLQETAPLAVVGVVQPTIFAPASSAPAAATPGATAATPATAPGAGAGAGKSLYVFGVGKVTEIRLDDAVIRDIAIPFDSMSDELYAGGVDKSWLGPDGKIYFGLQGRPARIGRYDPAAGKMELLGALQGHAVLQVAWGPGPTCYIVTYPCMLGAIDMASGKIRHLGRLADDGLYPQMQPYVSADGWLYCSTGPRTLRKIGVNLATGERRELGEFPAGEKAAVSAADFPDLSKQWSSKLDAQGKEAQLILTNLQDKSARTLSFPCSTVNRELQALVLAGDGRIYGSASYAQYIYDPANGKSEAPVFHLSIYDYLLQGTRLYMCGYPNSRLGVWDLDQPLATGGKKAIWEMKGEAFNPRELVCIYNLPNPEDTVTKGGYLAMKRAWSMALGVDGKLYIGNTASRQNWGGALAIYDPADGKTSFLRTPWFRFLGISEVCPVAGGKQIAMVTHVAPDPSAPGQEPPAARLLLYDVAAGKITLEATPLPDCKLLTSLALAPAPNDHLLVGIGLRNVEPSPEADNHYHGDGEVFFFDLRQGKTVQRIAFDFPVSRAFGRSITSGPDGCLWICGGGLIRLDPAALTATPAARIEGPDGNFIFVGDELYLSGGAGLRHGSIRPLLK